MWAGRGDCRTGAMIFPNHCSAVFWSKGAVFWEWAEEDLVVVAFSVTRSMQEISEYTFVWMSNSGVASKDTKTAKAVREAKRQRMVARNGRKVGLILHLDETTALGPVWLRSGLCVGRPANIDTTAQVQRRVLSEIRSCFTRMIATCAHAQTFCSLCKADGLC